MRPIEWRFGIYRVSSHSQCSVVERMSAHAHLRHFGGKGLVLDCTIPEHHEEIFLNPLPESSATPLLNHLSSITCVPEFEPESAEDQWLVPTAQPLYSHYSCIYSRLASFNSSFKSKLTPRSLANAGFFSQYIGGSSDRCRCFWCGLVIENAKSSPQKFHARSRPDCPFARTALKVVATKADLKDCYSRWRRSSVIRYFEDNGTPAHVVTEMLREIYEKKYPFPSIIEAISLLTGLMESRPPCLPSGSADTCKVCLAHQVATVFLPCAHATCCLSCSRTLIRCPICRQHVSGRYLLLFGV